MVNIKKETQTVNFPILSIIIPTHACYPIKPKQHTTQVVLYTPDGLWEPEDTFKRSTSQFFGNMKTMPHPEASVGGDTFLATSSIVTQKSLSQASS